MVGFRVFGFLGWVGRYNRSSGVFGFFSLREFLRVGVFVALWIWVCCLVVVGGGMVRFIWVFECVWVGII